MSKVPIDIHRHLLDSCIAGDRSACYELYRLYSRAMFNTAFRIVKNDQDAEDVLQESFISAFKGLGSFSNNSTFGAWLKRIVVNKSINYLRKRHVQVLSIEENKIDFYAGETDTFEEEYYSISAIKSAVNELAEGYRLVLTLYLFEGYDHQEISEILGISISTSKSQYNRAKKKLLSLIQKREVHYG